MAGDPDPEGWIDQHRAIRYGALICHQAQEDGDDGPEAREKPYERGDSEQFTGEVWLRRGPTAPGGTGMVVVHFSVGARTHWHMHPSGQFLFGLTGRGRVVPRGGNGHILLPGDIVYAPPGQWHYHGAGPNSPMAHVSVNIGGSPEFGEPVEPVTDKEYDQDF